MNRCKDPIGFLQVSVEFVELKQSNVMSLYFIPEKRSSLSVLSSGESRAEQGVISTSYFIELLLFPFKKLLLLIIIFLVLLLFLLFYHHHNIFNNL